MEKINTDYKQRTWKIYSKLHLGRPNQDVVTLIKVIYGLW